MDKTGDRTVDTRFSDQDDGQEVIFSGSDVSISEEDAFNSKYCSSAIDSEVASGGPKSANISPAISKPVGPGLPHTAAHAYFPPRQDARYYFSSVSWDVCGKEANGLPGITKGPQKT